MIDLTVGNVQSLIDQQTGKYLRTKFRKIMRGAFVSVSGHKDIIAICQFSSLLLNLSMYSNVLEGRMKNSLFANKPKQSLSL